ncbi:(d)CMP kinase [Alkalilimnicola ehrlichii]|uniref:(d)CMP kinase n=1 Tax=Alkalilimnicola ehrlichii TaxID=351052 RepID=UPI003BA322AA
MTGQADSNIPVLTLDGPSGAGKGTIARAVAEQLGWHLLDSGALYRLVALHACRHDVPLDDEGALAALARDLPAEFRQDERGEPHILLADEDVTWQIRTEQVGDAASRVAAIPAVREALLERQRAFRQPPGLVADGRDMGTVVFPDAPVKIFLTASAEERARRRYKQLKEQGASVTLASLSEEIAERDRRDAQRSAAPLRPSRGALELDTTGVPVDEVMGQVLARVKAYLAGEKG